MASLGRSDGGPQSLIALGRLPRRWIFGRDGRTAPASPRDVHDGQPAEPTTESRYVAISTAGPRCGTQLPQRMGYGISLTGACRRV